MCRVYINMVHVSLLCVNHLWCWLKMQDFPPPPETACFSRWCWYAWKLQKHYYRLDAAVCARSYLLAPQRRWKTSVHHSVHNKPEHNFDYLIPTRLRWDGFILSHWRVSSVRSLIFLPQHFVCFSQAAVLLSFPLFCLLQPNRDTPRERRRGNTCMTLDA